MMTSLSELIFHASSLAPSNPISQALQFLFSFPIQSTVFYLGHELYRNLSYIDTFAFTNYICSLKKCIRFDRFWML